ncbi:cytochrome c-type biogenesis protein CcmH [Massilia sp. PDC64]|nr:tetratricopeptide repeat protein [Massilia sp. PDC64]SDF11577.1 cytochrome c-type biogenesis protein CcmH [Massilia sp. PDC64]
MTSFLLGAIALVAIALAFALAPLLRRQPAAPSSHPTARPDRDWSPIAVGLVLPAAAVALYAAIGTPQAVLAPPPQAEAPAIGPAQIEAMVARLAERLKTEPDDVEGWRMLAHSYETLRRFDAAVEAYRHLIALEPNNANGLTDAAVALGMALNQDLSGEPERLIDRALAINPNHVQALALKGSAAYERGDYAQAIPPWKRILAMVPQDSEMARSIGASVAKAEALAAKRDRR